MPSIIKNYCANCDHPKMASKSIKKRMDVKLTDLSSRIVSHATISAKTIKAHPISTALLATAVLASFAGAGVIFAMGGPIGVVFIANGIAFAGLGAVGMSDTREKIEVDTFRKAHTWNDKTINRVKGKDVCLVLESEGDYNNSFRRERGPAKWEKKYPIVYMKVSSLDDVKQAIESVSEQANIQVLWHMGHGSEGGFTLGLNEDIDNDNIEDLKESYDKLSATATVIFNSCQIAKGDLASKISEVTEKRVIASTVNTNPYSIKLKMKKEAKISIQGSRWGSERQNFKQEVQDVGCGFIVEVTPNFIGKHFKKDVMHVYENGVLQDDRSHYVTV